jgi:hypothetical protein
MATLKSLPTCPRTTVFRKIVQILKNDPVLSNVIRPGSLRSWSGSSHDNVEFSYSQAPAIRLTPASGPEDWKYPDAQVGALYINVEMLVAGTDADDEINLWWAIERAIYPFDEAKRFAIVRELQQASAHSGLCTFSQPAFDPEPGNKFFAATGQIKIDVLLQLNT